MPRTFTTVESALREAAKRLKEVAGRPRLEAEILMAHHLGAERTWFHAHGDETLKDSEGYFALVQRRLACEPIEYITGRVSYYDTELEVGPGVLVARPETELLVEAAARLVEEGNLQRVCEIGVGSGAVSIVLMRKFPQLSIVATDISEKALGYARRNVERHGLEGRIRLVRTDLMEGLEEDFDLVVSNPPYIARDFPLPEPVRKEPGEALFGGERGDEVLRRILESVIERGIPRLACEMGYDQRERIVGHCRDLGLPEPEFYKDLAGLDRGFVLTNE